MSSFGRRPPVAGDASSVADLVIADNATGAFQLYEGVGMHPVLGWVLHEKELGSYPTYEG